MLAAYRYAALLAFSLLALGVGACSGVAPASAPSVTFGHLAPIRFDAAQVEFVDAYRPPLAAPNIEHQFQQTPAAAVRDWARQRIVAAGPAGVLRVTIHDASVVVVPLPVRSGLGGLFYDDQDTRYDAALDISLQYVAPNGAQSQARTRVVRTRTVPESISVNQRNQVFYELTKGLMDDLDQQIVLAARQYMANVIRP